MRFAWYVPIVALASALLCTGAVRAADSKTELPLSAFGLKDGTVVTGSNPRFDLYVPDYAAARQLSARFALQFPQNADPGSSVLLRVGDTTIAQSTVGEIRKSGGIAGTFANLDGSGRMLDVSVQSDLTVSGGECRDYDPRSLWMRVAPQTSLTVLHAASPTTIAQFFQDYDGRYAVTVAGAAPENLRLQAVTLGYWLEQIDRWRSERLWFLSKPPKPYREIVVGGANQDLAVRGGVLYANARGLDAIAAKAYGTLLAPSVEGAVAIRGKRIRSPATLAALGLGTRTQTGAGRMAFPVSFTLGTFGGLPKGLHFVMHLAHGAYTPEDRATATVFLNGAVINGFTLSRQGKTERFDVPIDESRLGGANQLLVVVEFVPKSICARASFSVSLLGSSALTWRGLNRYIPTIGEIMNGASGSAAIVSSEPNLDPYAFQLLERLGMMDPNLTDLVAIRKPSAALHVRYLFSVAPLVEPSGMSETARAAIASMRAAHVSFGVLESTRTSVPELRLAYTASAAALAAFGSLSSGELSGASSDVLLFNQRGVAFVNPDAALMSARTAPSPIRALWPFIAAGVVVAAVALYLIARRARKVS